MSKRSPGVGPMLRHWRDARKLSQLEASLDAEISARHLSCLETGRAQPSREMVLRLAQVYEVPLRNRNALLLAAGFAPLFRETDLDAPEMKAVRRVVDFLLERHEPYPAVLIDHHWNLRAMNDAAQRLLPSFVKSAAALTPPLNVMKILFDPDGMRPFIENWEALASAMIQRVHQERAINPGDPAGQELLDALLSAADVPKSWRQPDYGEEAPLLLPMTICRDGLRVSLFSTITTLGTPLDITLQELRMESFFPADPESDAVIQALAKA